MKLVKESRGNAPATKLHMRCWFLGIFFLLSGSILAISSDGLNRALSSVYGIEGDTSMRLMVLVVIVVQLGISACYIAGVEFYARWGATRFLPSGLAHIVLVVVATEGRQTCGCGVTVDWLSPFWSNVGAVVKNLLLLLIIWFPPFRRGLVR